MEQQSENNNELKTQEEELIVSVGPTVFSHKLERKNFNEVINVIRSGVKAKAIIDEDIIWFAYYNDKPIAFFILLPDLNQIIKPFNGKLNLWNMIRFSWAKVTHKMTRMRGIVGGVHPAHQNNGVESAIFYKLYEALRFKPWYKELELSWVGDFNPKMQAIYEAIGAHRAKTHITFRYMINEKLEFIRYKDEMDLNYISEKAAQNLK